MAALQQGDDAALAELITRWQPPLLRFVFRYVQNETDARELVHEAFVRLHERRMSYRAGSSFAGWIFTIAANLAHNRVRWRKRHPGERNGEMDVSPRELMCGAATPDESALRAERVSAVRAAIDALPHDLKITLLLFEYEGLSYREIAGVVGCSEKGVEARLARARARLRESLASFLSGPETVQPIAARWP